MPCAQSDSFNFCVLLCCGLLPLCCVVGSCLGSVVLLAFALCCVIGSCLSVVLWALALVLCYWLLPFCCVVGSYLGGVVGT